jgi:hypothetical protein
MELAAILLIGIGEALATAICAYTIFRTLSYLSDEYQEHSTTAKKNKSNENANHHTSQHLSPTKGDTMKRFFLLVIAFAIANTILFGPGDLTNRLALGILGLIVFGGGFLLIYKLFSKKD